jgi:hypothetical protein
VQFDRSLLSGIAGCRAMRYRIRRPRFPTRLRGCLWHPTARCGIFTSIQSIMSRRVLPDRDDTGIASTRLSDQTWASSRRPWPEIAAGQRPECKSNPSPRAQTVDRSRSSSDSIALRVFRWHACCIVAVFGSPESQMTQRILLRELDAYPISRSSNETAQLYSSVSELSQRRIVLS